MYCRIACKISINNTINIVGIFYKTPSNPKIYKAFTAVGTTHVIEHFFFVNTYIHTYNTKKTLKYSKHRTRNLLLRRQTYYQMNYETSEISLSRFVYMITHIVTREANISVLKNHQNSSQIFNRHPLSLQNKSIQRPVLRSKSVTLNRFYPSAVSHIWFQRRYCHEYIYLTRRELQNCDRSK